MTYEYPSTKEERAAADLLREKGWSVSAPTCPECHGWGFIGRSKTWGEGQHATSVISQEASGSGSRSDTLFFPGVAV